MEQSENDFGSVIGEMRNYRMAVPCERFRIRLPDAEKILRAAMTYFVGLEGRKAVWLDEYSEVSSWLSDNHGKGLLLSGNCGTGKSLLGRYVIPAILLKYFRLSMGVYDVQEMNKRIDEVLLRRIVSLDDIGTEGELVEYGNRRMAFVEIADRMEKCSGLLIVSTNLSGQELRARYGDRLLERVIAIMRIVEFKSKSLRG